MTLRESHGQHAFLMLNGLLSIAILALLITKFRLISLLNINWDEFLFASKIYLFERGELTYPLQIFHVHLFGWLKHVPGTGIDQIIAARETMFGLRVLGCLCVFVIGRKLYGTTGALVAVLASLSFSYMVMHGESFRADPIISFCFIAAAMLLIVWPERLAATLAASLFMALGMLVSIKTVIYGPTIATLLVITFAFADRRSRALRNAALFTVAALATATLLYLWHRSTLAPTDAPALGAKLADTGTRMWTAPSPHFFRATFDWDRAWWLLLLIGVAVALHRSFQGEAASRRSALTVLALVMPIATLNFYRNAFPYYYICLVPAAAIALGYLASLLPKALPQRPLLVAAVIGTAVLFTGTRTVSLVELNGTDTLAPQRQVLDVVHTLFPEPVPYIDRCAMVVNYPKLGIFMSTLVAGIYRERGEPVMQSLVEQHQPPFLLENSPGLYLDISVDELSTSPYRLLPEDHRYLQTHYQRHWGPIRVAGRAVRLEAGQPQQLSLPVAGPYTLEAASPVQIDGSVHAPGAVISMTSGDHELRSEEAIDLVLRYGDHLPRPPNKPPLHRDLFTGLRFRAR